MQVALAWPLYLPNVGTESILTTKRQHGNTILEKHTKHTCVRKQWNKDYRRTAPFRTAKRRTCVKISSVKAKTIVSGLMTRFFYRYITFTFDPGNSPFVVLRGLRRTVIAAAFQANDVLGLFGACAIIARK